MEANTRSIVVVACVVFLNIILVSFLYFHRGCPEEKATWTNTTDCRQPSQQDKTDTHSDTHSDTHTDTHSDTHTDTHSDTHTDSHSTHSTVPVSEGDHDHDHAQPLTENLKDRYKRYVPIAMALDDNVLYPTIVTMTSLVKSRNNNTVYDFYIMHPGYFTNESKSALQKFSKIHDCRVQLIDMGDDFTEYNPGPGKAVTYYRLKLPMLLPDVDKIIWLDSDVVALGDITSMYDLDMEGLCFRGYLDINVDGLAYLGISTAEDDHYICAGILLINLAELRNEDYLMQRTFKFMNEHKGNLKQHDQTVINYMFYKKIAPLPTKYCMFNYMFYENGMRSYRNTLIAKNKYSWDELMDTLKHPVMVHCVFKPYVEKDIKYSGFAPEWWEYAKVSGFHDEIMAKYRRCKELLDQRG